MKKFFFSLMGLIAISFIFSACTKTETKGAMDHPGIAFTFDDNYVDDWYKMLPLFDSFNVKATFYVSNYNKLTGRQKDKLKAIQKQGHEIAFHTTNHYNMNEYLSTKSMDSLMKYEVVKGLERMNADGFYPKTFAYPYGQHNISLDNELLKRFKSVRALNGTNNLAKSMAGTDHNKVLYGLGIDESSNRNFDLILKLFGNCKVNSNCLVLVAHHVEKPETGMQLPMEKLRTLIKDAYSKNLKFYTISEISG